MTVMTALPQPCERAVGSNDIMGAPCSFCGHSDLVHPGRHNPSLRHCAICEILHVAARLEEQGLGPRIMVMGTTWDEDAVQRIRETLERDGGLREDTAGRREQHPDPGSEGDGPGLPQR